MCIRDSPGAPHGHPRRHRRRGALPRLAARQVDDRHQRHGCLLYTSDAADDLLCVDLGGRRIINKNKALKPDITDLTRYREHTIDAHSGRTGQGARESILVDIYNT